MSYKPKYCCECGEKIERADWGWTTSRRFCDLCETDFKHVDWMPRLALLAGLLLITFAVGLFFRKPEKNLAVSSNQPQNFLSGANQNAAVNPAAQKQASNSTISQQPGDSLTMPPKAATEATTTKQPEKTKSTENQPTAVIQDVVYFCGAQTKKGTPCTRHVKIRGARCWQHEGQPAMLPPDKLIAN